MFANIRRPIAFVRNYRLLSSVEAASRSDEFQTRRRAVHEIIYLIGLIVVISFLLGVLGFR
jgi:hypothetical protein